MKIIAISVVLQIIILKAVAPPVHKATKMDMDEGNVDPLEWTSNMEYKHYLMEVLNELEKDKEFQKRLKNVTQHNTTESIADQLQFVSHNVRTRLDEIKRREIVRLNELVAKKEKLEEEDRKDRKDHLDHSNPHSFEIQDLRRLINKVASDLVQTDKEQDDDFKKYEMEKELKQRQELKKIKDKKEREALKQKIEESKKRHRNHEPLHHPGSEEQLKAVWEKEDHLDRDAFDPKTFFRMHDTDSNGHLDAGEVEALMMNELEKVYNESNPDDDVVERYHEMMKMRQEIMREVDTDNDKMVSYDEFMTWTRKKDFKEDPGWKTTEELEKPVFTDDEIQRYAETYKAEHPEMFEDAADHEDGKPDPRHISLKMTDHNTELKLPNDKTKTKDAKAEKL